MPTKHCCPECFDDRGLRDNIFPSLGAIQGKCSFCGASDVDLVEPKALADYFELLTNVYELNRDGKPLVEWMKEDWQLFPDGRLDTMQATKLLSEILDNGEIVRQPFSPSLSYQSEGLVQWETLRDELMSRNRWFLDEELDTDRLGELLDHLLDVQIPEEWYRARICAGNQVFATDDMGAPPNRVASHGRANPAGIPYLYLASKPETAVAEIRPHTGDLACVATFMIPNGTRAVDLRNPRKLVSPFILAGADEIGQLRADLPLLERLGEELTRPVLPDSAAIDYIPSQFLCEFIKKSSFDGVVYGSSVSDGINLALFDPGKSSANSVQKYTVSRVSVKVTPS